MEKIIDKESYLKSISNRNLKIYLMGELVENPLDHPIIRPSIEAMAETYDLAVREPLLASVKSPYTGENINRFLHIAESSEDLFLQNKMQRKLGQLTGTCFQRCVGMDAFNALHSVTYEIDEKYSTEYHSNFVNFLTEMHRSNLVVGGAMTDVKGDRSKLPHEQEDEDLYLRIVDRNKDGVFVKGAKAHQTGCINSHWMVVMPTLRLTDKDKDYAIVGAIPVDADGITYIYGRQSCITKSGNFINDDLLANVCKQHVTKETFEIGRIAQDLAGGLVGSMPSGIDFNEGAMSEDLKKYLKGKKDINSEDRVKILRLIENMTLGRNAVAYLTESLHGAGSPQAQRVQIRRGVDMEKKKEFAKKLSGVTERKK